MKLVYIAGPYRGPNTWAIEQNIRRAEDAAALVWKAGLAALCPHANSRHMDGVTSDDNFLAGTLEMMRRCDAVLVLEGWLKSSGSQSEVSEAMRLGKPVLYTFGDESYLVDILRDLAAMDPGFMPMRHTDPFAGIYWLGRYTP